MATATDLYNQGVNFLSRGEYAKAVSLLSEAIRLNPACPDYYSKRGDALLELGDFVKSTADYDKANQIRTS